MARNPELLRADARDELIRIKRLEETFSAAEHLLAKPAEEVGDYDRGAVGYLLHNFVEPRKTAFLAIFRVAKRKCDFRFAPFSATSVAENVGATIRSLARSTDTLQPAHVRP